MRRVVLIAVIMLAVVASVWTFRFANQVIGIPREAYASDWTAVFIIEHIRTTGTWPTGWHDLRDEYDRLAVPEHYAWTFDELHTLINVNWDVSVDEIRDCAMPMNNVQLTSGRQVSYNGDPDALIYDYLRSGEDPHQIRERIGDLGNHPMQPSGEVGRFEVEDQSSPPADR